MFNPEMSNWLRPENDILELIEDRVKMLEQAIGHLELAAEIQIGAPNPNTEHFKTSSENPYPALVDNLPDSKVALTTPEEKIDDKISAAEQKVFAAYEGCTDDQFTLAA